MAEEELDGFDDLDNLFGDEGSEGDTGGGNLGDLDDLLGDADSGGEGEDASDSELDSFFEDLSTIDDLEVAQAEPDPQVAPVAAAAATTVAAAAMAEEKPAVQEKAKKPKARKEAKGGLGRRLAFLLLPLLVLGGVFYWLFIRPSEEVPWDEVEETVFIEEPVVEERLELPLPPPEEPPLEEPPPPPVAQPAPPEPVTPPPAKPAPTRPAAPRVTYGIQVATCFFDSCVEAFRSRLEANGIPVRVATQQRNREALEILSRTVFAVPDIAQQLAERINRENRLEGQAYVRSSGNGFLISMGTFTDLNRANIVKDSLNQNFQGQVFFTTRIRQIPYTLRNVVGGRYPSRGAANSARERLAAAQRELADSFVVRN